VVRFVDHDQIVAPIGSVLTPDVFLLNPRISAAKAISVSAAQCLERE
jgi:hypothetical protein